MKRCIPFFVGGAILLAAGPADAVTYCVHRPGCSIDVNKNFDTIQLAVDKAAMNDSPGPIKDTILVGSGDFAGFTNTAGHPIAVNGLGTGTVVSLPAGDIKTVVKLGDPADTMTRVTVRMPAGANNRGVQGGTLTQVDVSTAGAQTGKPFGIYLSDFTDGKIDVPGAFGAVESTVRRAFISALVGANNSTLVDSIVRVSGAGVGLSAATSAKARNVDFVGDGTAGSVAVLLDEQVFHGVIDVRSSIIRGFEENFSRQGHDNGGPNFVGDIVVAYSDFDPNLPATESGPGTLNTFAPGHNTAADPGFASASDLHLRFDSALVDAGDPDGPALDEPTVDLDGLSRKVAGTTSGAPRVDIGALEYQRLPPEITVATASTAAPVVHAPVSFHAEATQSQGEAVTLDWDFGDGQSASGGDVTHAFETGGPKTVRLTARGASGATASRDIALDVVNHAPSLLVSVTPGLPTAGIAATFHAITEDIDGDSVTVAWDFGDGQGTIGPDPSHTYSRAGTYPVAATATDSGGGTTVKSFDVTVKDAPGVVVTLCKVPKLKGRTLKGAKAAIRKAGCKLGNVKKPHLKRGQKRLKLVVRSQSPKAGKKVPRGTKVNLKLGPKPRH